MLPLAYIVKASTGSWDMQRNWVVAVHLDEALAKGHVEQAKREAAALIAERAWEQNFSAPTASDPQLEVMEGHVAYSYVAVPLVGRDGLQAEGLLPWFPQQTVRKRAAGDLESPMQAAFARLKASQS